MSLPFNATYYIDVPRDEKAEKLILQYGVRKKLKAGEFLIRAGEAVTTINYLLSGALTHLPSVSRGLKSCISITLAVLPMNFYFWSMVDI